MRKLLLLLLSWTAFSLQQPQSLYSQHQLLNANIPQTQPAPKEPAPKVVKKRRQSKKAAAAATSSSQSEKQFSSHFQATSNISNISMSTMDLSPDLTTAPRSIVQTTVQNTLSYPSNSYSIASPVVTQPSQSNVQPSNQLPTTNNPPTSEVSQPRQDFIDDIDLTIDRHITPFKWDSPQDNSRFENNHSPVSRFSAPTTVETERQQQQPSLIQQPTSQIFQASPSFPSISSFNQFHQPFLQQQHVFELAHQMWN
jgi:hypothetical protein